MLTCVRNRRSSTSGSRILIKGSPLSSSAAIGQIRDARDDVSRKARLRDGAGPQLSREARDHPERPEPANPKSDLHGGAVRGTNSFPPFRRKRGVEEGPQGSLRDECVSSGFRPIALLLPIVRMAKAAAIVERCTSADVAAVLDSVRWLAASRPREAITPGALLRPLVARQCAQGVSIGSAVRATATLCLRSASESCVHTGGVPEHVLADVDARPGDAARETALRDTVVLGDRRAGVLADIHQVVGGE
jgi:hypothetical protein